MTQQESQGSKTSPVPGLTNIHCMLFD